MRKIYLLFLFIFSTFSFGQNLDWVYFTTQKPTIPVYHQVYNHASSFAIDSDENIYIIGQYMDHMGFDEDNPTTYQLVSQHGYPSPDCFLVKLDKNKKLLWTKTIRVGDNSYAQMINITIDKDDSVIITGVASGKDINLNPDASSPVLYGTDLNRQSGVFVNKYNKNGNFIFGNFYLGAFGNPKVITDKDKNIIVSSYYTNYNGFNTDFDLSSQEYFLEGPNSSTFLLKLDENGSFKTAKFISGVANFNFRKDHSENIVIFGSSGGTINFNNERSIPNSNSQYNSNEDFLLKLDPTLTVKWFQGLGGNNYNSYFDSSTFAIDSDNSIVAVTYSIKETVPFTNANVNIQDDNVRSVVYKVDENGKYLWHSSLASTNNSQSQSPTSLTISQDHVINVHMNTLQGVYDFYAVNKQKEQIMVYSNGGTSSLLKLNSEGKLIYNKHKIFKSQISRFDNNQDKFYFLSSGKDMNLDQNPDQNIIDVIPYSSDYTFGIFLQKLDKCYSGTPDGEPYFYTCISAEKKIKDLHPKTSYSSWYDSPTSTTPLSPETILTTKKYYAETQDVSCPNNPTRLEVDVRVFQNPPKLVVSDFTFCNLQGKRLADLNINNNQNVEFFDAGMKPLYLSTYLVANAKYYVLQTKSYSNYAFCRSELTEFFVYDTSVPPTAVSNQNFCKINNPTISDIQVNGINLKWYDATGIILPITTILQDQTKYYVSQTSGTCESAKAEITIQLNDPDPPIGNANQHFCSAQNATLADIQISGTAIKWYNLSGISLPVTTLLADGEIYFATQTINNCESTQKLQVKININANAVAGNDYSETFCDDDTDNLKSLNLNDYRSRLVVDFQNYSFDFYDKNDQLGSNEIIISVGLTEFAVKITSALGCYKTVKLSFTLNPKPQLHLPPKLEFCEGLPVILDAGSGFKKYLWNTGEKTQTISTDQEGTYSVTVTNSFDCSNTGSIPVTKSITATIKNITIVNNTATITISEVGEYLYSLDHMNWQSSNVFSNLENRTYTVSIKTTAGCMLGIENFTIFSVPNSFTPNADGINDLWTISGLENYVNSEITIVDKNGREVLKTLINGKFKWDGKLLGRPLPTDVYWYLIKISDGRILQGSVLLKNRN